MDPAELHVRYAPVLHFARAESFYPMGVGDFLSYAALFSRDQTEPTVPRGQVRAEHLARSLAGEAFLRSVDRGPLWGGEVAREWGSDTLRAVNRWAQSPTGALSEILSRQLYDWFSATTSRAAQLFWWNRFLIPAGPGEGDRPSDLPRFRLPSITHDSAVENYEASRGPRPRCTYHYRLAPMGDYVALQYWFFYAFNDWANAFGGLNDHEGDWEAMQILFRREAGNRPVEPPAYVCYLGHQSRITKPWEHPDIQRSGTHPHVYVAAGSHASYPECKPYTIMSLYNLVDYATGDGLTLDHQDWGGRLDLDTTPWVCDYRGSWGTRYWLSLAWLRRALSGLVGEASGEISLPGVSAPRGPRYDDQGHERETWADTVRFAGLGGVS